MMNECNEQEFEDVVLNADGPVCVMFYADWAGPVHMAKDMLKKVKKRNVRIVGMNIDENPHVPFEYAVKAVPTFILFQNKLPVRVLAGAVQPKDMEDFLHGTVLDQ